MTAPCPTCGEQAPWARVEATPAKTTRSFRCGCGAKFTREEPAHPPEFFQPTP